MARRIPPTVIPAIILISTVRRRASDNSPALARNAVAGGYGMASPLRQSDANRAPSALYLINVSHGTSG